MADVLGGGSIIPMRSDLDIMEPLTQLQLAKLIRFLPRKGRHQTVSSTTFIHINNTFHKVSWYCNTKTSNESNIM